MNTHRLNDESLGNQSPSDTFKICFHRPNGTLDGFFNNIDGYKLDDILKHLPNGWIATVFNINKEEILFSHRNSL